MRPRPDLKHRQLALAILMAFSGASTAQTALPDVNVTSDREGYTARSSDAATRTDTPVHHIPQSVVTVTKTVIEDQGVRTVSEALRNVSNINQVDARDANNTAFKIRGFTSATVVDGVAMPGYFPNHESLTNVQRIDVVKGPAGGLFGSGQGVGGYASFGGTLAITTNEPGATPYRQVGVSLGSYGQRGLNFDLNQPLNQTVAFRFAGEFNRSDSETDRVYFRRTALFPSLSWTPNADSKLVVRLRYLDNTTLDYSGLPPDGTLDTSTFKLPRSLFVTATGLPATTNTSRGINVQWTQRLSERWKFSLVAAHNETEVDQRGVFPFPFGGPGASQALAGARLWDKWRTTTLSPSLTGTIQSAGVKHTISTGVDLERTKDNAYMAFSNGFGLLSFFPTDLRNPVFPAWVEPVAPAVPDQRNTYSSTVAYVQDQIDIGNWHLLGSLRYSHLKVDDNNASSGINNQSSNSKFTPRLGAVYEFSPRVSAFAGYSEGIKVPTVALFAQPPKPEESRQMEIGLRLKAMAGVTATIAVFDLVRKNAAVADAANPGFSMQTGKQQSKGLDADLRWQASPSWTWLLAFTSQKATIVEDTNAALVNKQLFNVPEKTLRLAGRYEVRGGQWSGLGMGMGLTYQSDTPIDSTNTRFASAVTVWDAQISYRTGQARFGLSINNLTNKQYYLPSAYFSGGQVMPALPRTLMATASLNF